MRTLKLVFLSICSAELGEIVGKANEEQKERPVLLGDLGYFPVPVVQEEKQRRLFTEPSDPWEP